MSGEHNPGCIRAYEPLPPVGVLCPTCGATVGWDDETDGWDDPAYYREAEEEYRERVTEREQTRLRLIDGGRDA